MKGRFLSKRCQNWEQLSTMQVGREDEIIKPGLRTYLCAGVVNISGILAGLVNLKWRRFELYHGAANKVLDFCDAILIRSHDDMAAGRDDSLNSQLYSSTWNIQSSLSGGEVLDSTSLGPCP